MSNIEGLRTVWLTLSLSNDCCLPGAGSLSALTWGDPTGSVTIFRVSVFPLSALCATVWVQTLRHCSVVLKAKPSYSFTKQFLYYYFSIPFLLYIISTFLDNWHIFSAICFILPCCMDCNFHEHYLPPSFCSFPQSLLLLGIVFFFHNILVFFCLTYQIDFSNLETFCINRAKYRSCSFSSCFTEDKQTCS